MTQYVTIEILLFAAIQIVNVVLATVRSILTVNGSKLTAASISSISYTIGAITTKLLTQQTFEVVVIVTFLTNLIGVYIAKLILEKSKKAKLWTITATLRSDDKDTVETELKRRGVQFTLCPALNDRFLIDIFSYSKGESTIVKEIMRNCGARFTITENFVF